MSIVSSLILAHHEDDDFKIALDKLCDSLDIPHFLDVNDAWQGRKAFEIVTLVGSYNMFPTEELIEFLKAWPWKWDAQLFIREQDDEKYQLRWSY